MRTSDKLAIFLIASGVAVSYATLSSRQRRTETQECAVLNSANSKPILCRQVYVDRDKNRVLCDGVAISEEAR